MARRLNQEARKEESPIKGNPFSYNSKTTTTKTKVTFHLGEIRMVLTALI